MSYNEYLDPNSNYPPMSQSQWDSAPWNQSEPPEREFDVTVSQTLSKRTTIATSKYQPEVDDEDGSTYANTEYTDWKEVYEDVCYTPLQLIGKLKTILEDAIAKEQVTGHLKHTYEELIEECEGWEEDDYEVIEE